MLLLGFVANAQNNIQTISETALLKILKKQAAVNGLVIVKEVATGKEIVSVGFTAKKNKTGAVYYAKDASLKDAMMEPGGLIVPMSAAILMDNFGVQLSDTVDLEEGKTIIGSTSVLDAERHGYKNVPLNQVIAKASNVGIAKLSVKHLVLGSDLYINSLKSYLQSDDFLYSTNESLSNLAYASFGYGIMMSPAQILNFYNRVAANEPNLFKNETTLVQTKQALLEVSENGTTMNLLHGSKTKIASKTGTTLALGKNGYKDKQYYASIVGFAPYHNPRYTCIVIIKNKPHAVQYYGAQVAGPVFKEIMDALNK
jgi:cell division protein FtsI (penicillin-binding protein 3)